MHIGFQVSNIIESSLQQENYNVSYKTHGSLFDVVLSECSFLNLFCKEAEKNRYKDNERIYNFLNSSDAGLKSYSVSANNSIHEHSLQNMSVEYHINTIIFNHGSILKSIKKEDLFLITNNLIKENDLIIFFNNNNKTKTEEMLTYKQRNIEYLEYSIPACFFIDNTIEKTKIGIFKNESAPIEHIVEQIDKDIVLIDPTYGNADKINSRLNEYEICIELDASNIVNCLVAIATGAISIILDPNRILEQYRNIKNLIRLSSIEEIRMIMGKLKSKAILYQEDNNFNSTYRDFDRFQNTIKSIMLDNNRKAFIL